MGVYPPEPTTFDMKLALSSSFEENRRALQSITEALRAQDHHGAAGGAWELVLAELLNNVVEHAYAGRSDASIDLTVRWTQNKLTALIVDDGNPMPNGELPGSAASLDEIDPNDHPEGGFGWGLIHMLSQSIEYARDNGKNRTRVVVRFDGR